MLVELNAEFNEVIQPLGQGALEFFLAASLYHAKKVSCARAAEIANLSLEAFCYRLEEHFNQGYIIADESVLEDIQTLETLK